MAATVAARGPLPLALLAISMWSRGAVGDLYMQNPRGSNNRLTEQSNNAQNQNRLFDSQNNAAGGYMVGDNCFPNCKDGNNGYAHTKAGSQDGAMYFYHGSELQIEWTTQHGCGFPGTNTLCQLVIQYMCKSDSPGLRNGRDSDNSRRRSGGGNNNNPAGATREAAAELERGQHESFEFYDACRKRERNKGLYNADQNVNNNRGATATRQNNNGNRRGLECPEERDYYPYWHPSEWRDIVVMTSNPEHCAFYRNESQNVQEKGYCELALAEEAYAGNNQNLNAEDQVPNTEKGCIGKGGVWRVKEAWDIDPPECIGLPESRDNHHGNIKNGQMASYLWEIPDTIPDNDECVLRMRYNISSGDFNKAPTEGDEWDPFFDLDAKFNGDNALLKGNPKDDFIGLGWERSGPLQIQVNTAQFGRVFQDRSHMFRVKKRPDNVFDYTRIVNLNVRGRRGNIVQVYPSVEYDFVPDNLEVNVGDYVHFQWTGSDANPNGNAGNGRQGTDRSNLVQIGSRAGNKPVPIEKHTLFFDAANVDWDSDEGVQGRRLVEKFAFLDQQEWAAKAGNTCPKNKQEITDRNLDDNDDDNCYQLNAAPAYFDAGLVEMKVQGTHHFASTRNNDYTNRSHKATIKVGARHLPAWMVGALSAASIAVVAATVMTLSAWYAYMNPLSEAFSRRNRPLLLRLPCCRPCVRRKDAERQAYKEELKKAWARAAERQAGLPAKASSYQKLQVEQQEEVVELQKSIKVNQPPPSRCCACCNRSLRRSLCCCVCPACRNDEGEADWATILFFFMQIAVPFAGWANNRNGGFMWWYGIAKAGGYMLDFNLACLLLPTMRSVHVYAMQVRALDDLFNDDPIYFHKVCFSFVIIGTMLHVGGHVMHVKAITEAPRFQVITNAREALSGLSVWEIAFDYRNRFAVLTGVIIFLLMAAMMLTASERVRRHTFKRGIPGRADLSAYFLLGLAGFCLAPIMWPIALGRCCARCCCGRRAAAEGDQKQDPSKRGTLGGFVIFWAVHKLWAPVFILLLVHGPQCWIWFLFPIILLVCDRLVSRERRSTQVVLTSAQLLKGNVLKCMFSVPPGFTYQAGHYIQINCDQVNGEEWHPFTLTSAPEENFLSVHIRCPDNLDWCSALRRTLVEGPAQAMSEGKEKGPGCRVTFAPQQTQRAHLAEALRHQVEDIIYAVPQKMEVLDVDGVSVKATYQAKNIVCVPPWLKEGRSEAPKEGEEEGEEKSPATKKKEAARSMSLNSFVRATAMPMDAVRMRIDGPHGAPSERVWKHRVVMLVGAGIGVTPFASVLKSLQLRVKAAPDNKERSAWRKELEQSVADGGKKKSKSSSGSPTAKNKSGASGGGSPTAVERAMAKLNWQACEGVHFFWLCRSQEEFKWFSGLLSESIEGPAKDRIKINLYITGTVDTKDLKSVSAGFKTHAGRPDWPKVFPSIAEQHPGEEIGVFLCGPKAIRTQLVTNSNWAATQDKNGTRFNVYSENF